MRTDWDVIVAAGPPTAVRAVVQAVRYRATDAARPTPRERVGVGGQLRREVPAQGQGVKAVNGRPGRYGGSHHRVRIVAPEALLDRAVQDGEGPDARRLQLGVVGVVEVGAQHDLEVRPMGEGEADVCQPAV